MSDNNREQMRLDKWLWCARFYKTRGLASEAIKAGKVRVDGEKSRPARNIAAGNRLHLRRGAFEHDLTVLALSKSRRSAQEAAHLYEETAESIEKRRILSEQMKLDALHSPQTHGRPTKRDRRDLIRFKNRN